MEKFKILFLDHAPFAGGAQLALARHLKFLDRSKFAAVVASADPDVFQELLEKDGERTARFKKIPLGKLKTDNIFSAAVNFFRSTSAVFALMERENPVLVVANTERSFYVAFLPVLVLRKPLIVFLRDFEFSKKLLRVIGFGVRRFLCVSKSVRRFYFSENGNKTQVVYVGTDLATKISEVKDIDLASLRQRYRISEEFIVGFVGRLVEWKDPLVLVDIAKVLAESRKDLPSWKIVVVGEARGQAGDISERLKSSISESGLESKFLLAGFSQEVQVWYRLFNVLLHTSKKPEPFATVVVEALAAGVPVLAVSGGGTPEIVEDGRNGFLVSNRDEFVDRLTAVMKDPTLITRLREGALKTAESFEESKITKEIEAIYLKVIDSG